MGNYAPILKWVAYMTTWPAKNKSAWAMAMSQYTLLFYFSWVTSRLIKIECCNTVNSIRWANIFTVIDITKQAHWVICIVKYQWVVCKYPPRSVQITAHRQFPNWIASRLIIPHAAITINTALECHYSTTITNYEIKFDIWNHIHLLKLLPNYGKLFISHHVFLTRL